MRKNYLKNLKKQGNARKIPNISEQNAQFIGNIFLKNHAENILEIGTANGYSSLSFCDFLETHGHKNFSIITLEYAWNAHNEAVEHYKNTKTKNIFPVWGDAKSILPSFRDNFFDAIYIDAMKKEYLAYFLLSLPKARENAIFIFDDVEKFSHKMEDLYAFLHEKNIPYQLEKTDEDDSIMIIYRNNIPL